MAEKPFVSAELPAVDPTVADRQQLLDTFTEQPNDNATWETAYAWTRAEGDQSGQSGIAAIPAEELIAMADTIRHTEPAKRYELMTSQASDGRRWFDVIEGFSMDSIRQALRNTIATAAQQNQAPFSHALDLGTGTGKSLSVLEPSAQRVVGVDRNQALLTVAKQRAGANTNLLCADITKLPFEDGSFDLMSGLGIEGSLDKDTQIAFYTELARVLMPGGVFVSAFYNYPYQPSEDMAKITQTSKATLADMICDTVSGSASITERLDNTQMDSLLTKLGLHREYYLDAEADEKNQAIIQVIAKGQTFAG